MKNYLKHPIWVLLIVNLLLIRHIAGFSSPQEMAYTVLPGDTVNQLAERFETSAEQIISKNNLAVPSLIIPGQILVIPSLGETTVPSSPPAGATIHSNSANNSMPRSLPVQQIGAPEAMKVSVNMVNVEPKYVLQALALSMNKQILITHNAQKNPLSFKIFDMPLLSLFDHIAKNEQIQTQDMGDIIIVNPQIPD